MSEHGNFHWNELMTPDAEASKAFFEKTIGWTFDAFPMKQGSYWVAMQNGKPVAGVMSSQGMPAANESPQWVSYLAVDDIDARVATVEASGGKVMMPPFDIPQVGRIAMVTDPTGAIMGWITPAPM